MSSSVIVAGLMLLFGTFDTEDFSIGMTTEYVADEQDPFPQGFTVADIWARGAG